MISPLAIICRLCGPVLDLHADFTPEGWEYRCPKGHLLPSERSEVKQPLAHIACSCGQLHSPHEVALTLTGRVVCKVMTSGISPVAQR